MTPTFNSEPNPRWIMSQRDLPQDRCPARYRFKRSNGETTETTLKDRKRQVVDALINGELFCASTVRIGDVFFRLKEDNDIRAQTLPLSNGRKYYALSGVTCLGPVTATEGAQ